MLISAAIIKFIVQIVLIQLIKQKRNQSVGSSALQKPLFFGKLLKGQNDFIKYKSQGDVLTLIQSNKL